ncbi:MAG: hypothetical protein C4575_11800 [Desulforudis sp.]|nr:MAG: hypothetical protein C4575_11800 [Desulforudis sp.]
MYRWIGVVTFLAVALVLGWTKMPGEAEVRQELFTLPSIRSCNELAKLLEESRQRLGNVPIRVGQAERMMAENSGAAAPAAKQAAGSRDDYSTTNVQVEGVDEADIVKTDGEYIYQVNNRRVLIIRAHPSDSMTVKKVIEFPDAGFNPRDIYVDREHLVVVGTSYPGHPEKHPPFVRPSSGTVKAVVFNIRNKDSISEVRTVEIEGDYRSSRKIGKDVYLVANRYPEYHILRDSAAPASSPGTPVYRDTQAGKDYIRVKCTDICYFPGFIEPNYLIVGGFSLDSPERAQVGTYLGAGTNVYVSTDNLYVATTRYDHGPIRPMPAIMPESPRLPGILPFENREETTIYRFALDNGRVVFNGQGSVPGTILNQFSMDEFGGFFRVATTQSGWQSGISRNSLYVLDENLGITGRIEDIAPGERIYSARFMGQRGYMVTFKTTDPLFVFDLSNPQKPTILGALKIPGFSNYLHPYDENHLIGFGKDALEAVHKNPDGTVVRQGFAYEQGMKVALFDVTDVNNPVEKYAIRIGDRGTDSEVLHNHKALLFDREKNLLAFPITVTEIKDQSAATPPWEYGSFVFQGAYVYDLSLDRGFVLKGKLTHRSGEDYLKAGQDWYYSDRDINRILFIKDNLYTLSDRMVQANDLQSLTLRGSLTLSKREV